MTTAQVVETSVNVNNNSPIQDYVHPDDQTQPTFKKTPGFKPFTDVYSYHIWRAWYNGSIFLDFHSTKQGQPLADSWSRGLD